MPAARSCFAGNSAKTLRRSRFSVTEQLFQTFLGQEPVRNDGSYADGTGV